MNRRVRAYAPGVLAVALLAMPGSAWAYSGADYGPMVPLMLGLYVGCPIAACLALKVLIQAAVAAGILLSGRGRALLLVASGLAAVVEVLLLLGWSGLFAAYQLLLWRGFADELILWNLGATAVVAVPCAFAVLIDLVCMLASRPGPAVIPD